MGAARNSRVQSIHGDWPHLRRGEICVICQGDKPEGLIVCERCTTDKPLASMVGELQRAEMALRWLYERNADSPTEPHRDDPALSPCTQCGSSKVTFMTSETPEKIVAERISTAFRYYVRCLQCGLHTAPTRHKNLAAGIWNRLEYRSG